MGMGIAFGLLMGMEITLCRNGNGACLKSLVLYSNNADEHWT